jgi:hypothetical protein
MTTAKLQDEIQAAQVVFVTAASRLLDEAEDVRQHRDRLLKLLDEQAAAKAKEGGDRAK